MSLGWRSPGLFEVSTLRNGYDGFENHGGFVETPLAIAGKGEGNDYR
jgi:hypothetical protein